MKVCDTIQMLESEKSRKLMTALYGEAAVDANIERYQNLVKSFQKKFAEEDVTLFSSPGRTEISGNHTDHNHGKVLAGSINLDCVGVAAKNNSSKVHIISETFNQSFIIDLNDLSPSDKKAGTIDLVKGLLQGFKESGYEVGGFNAYITSNVISAAGVSSSASFEMLLCSILNTFFNEGRMDTVAYAHIGKYSENVYWDKASGLLDQMACAVGGLITIDFLEPASPVVEKIDFDFSSQNHSLIIVNTGKGHADLSADYSSVPIEMKKVAEFFGKEVCAEITEEEVIGHLAEVREYAGDRSVLRALHFFEENKRVEAEVKALKDMGCRRGHTSMQGLGYKEILDYLEGRCSLDEAVYILKRDTRHFAKRQLTWFKRERDVRFLNLPDFGGDVSNVLERILEDCAKQGIVLQ